MYRVLPCLFSFNSRIYFMSFYVCRYGVHVWLEVEYLKRHGVAESCACLTWSPCHPFRSFLVISSTSSLHVRTSGWIPTSIDVFTAKVLLTVTWGKWREDSGCLAGASPGSSARQSGESFPEQMCQFEGTLIHYEEWWLAHAYFMLLNLACFMKLSEWDAFKTEVK